MFIVQNPEIFTGLKRGDLLSTTCAATKNKFLRDLQRATDLQSLTINLMNNKKVSQMLLLAAKTNTTSCPKK